MVVVVVLVMVVVKSRGSYSWCLWFALIFPQCTCNLSKLLLLLLTTYYMSHVLHVMQYTRFELYIVQNFLPLTWHVFVPLWSGSGQ